jgi:hypothetical protein
LMLSGATILMMSFSAKSALAGDTIGVDWGISRQQAQTTGDTGQAAYQGAMQGYALAQARQQERMFRHEQILKRQVGELYAQGKCREAVAASITGGDFELASLVADACAYAPKRSPAQ